MNDIELTRYVLSLAIAIVDSRKIDGIRIVPSTTKSWTFRVEVPAADELSREDVSIETLRVVVGNVIDEIEYLYGEGGQGLNDGPPD